MSLTFESIENWISRVMPQVISCPRELALDALQSVAVDFFKESRVWIYEDAVEVPAGTCDVEMPLPDYSEIVAIESIRINGVHCTKIDYTWDHHTVHLHNAPNAKAVLKFELILRPTRFCVDVPADLMEEYGDIIVHGALFKLKSMTGEAGGEEKTITWSNPDAAKFNYEIYDKGLRAAKLRSHVIRGYGLAKPVR